MCLQRKNKTEYKTKRRKRDRKGVQEVGEGLRILTFIYELIITSYFLSKKNAFELVLYCSKILCNQDSLIKLTLNLGCALYGISNNYLVQRVQMWLNSKWNFIYF